MADTNYFYVLLKTRANLLSEAAAARVAGGVVLALEGVLAPAQFERLVALLPHSATYAERKFYYKVAVKPKPFNQAVLYYRLETLLNLSGPDEAEQYIAAYLSSARVLMSDSDSRKFEALLPPQLAVLYRNT